MTRRTALAFAAVVAVALGIAAACSRPRMASGPIPQEIYVWQRVWSPAVRDAVMQSGSAVQGHVYFAGQISPAEPKKSVVRVPIDFAAVNKTGRPAALAIRIEPYAGPFRADDEVMGRILALAKELLLAARGAGVEPSELQIDFDCAESKLAGYRVWLSALRAAVAPVKICPTVLPAWLKRSEFKALAKECGEYVLQVHCVAPPRELGTMGPLTDPELTRRWVSDAARIGVPFRVALPTYSYLVAFGPDGKARGVSAEGPSARWAADSTVVRWEADPAVLSSLLADWNHSRPALMKGVIWFRLPIEGDTLNWRWNTLAMVMSGRVPARRLKTEVSLGQPSDLTVVNDGEQDEALPKLIEASWTESRLLAADALQDYELQQPEDGTTNHLLFRLRSNAELSRLPPGSRRPIGWIRCESATQIRLAIVPSANRAAANHPVVNSAAGPGDGD